MRIRTVFFDFGGTLGTAPASLRKPWMIWAEVSRKHDVPLADDQIQRAIAETDKELGGRIYDYLGRTDEFWQLYDRSILERLGIRERRADIESEIQLIFRDPTMVRLYPETKAVLTELRGRDYQLGLISNHHDGLLTVLKYHGLDRLLDTITYSQEVGAEKPDPAVFARALERAGCLPAEAVHVGDSIEADVEGARRSGIGAVWVNRAGATSASGCPTIRSLSELAPVLARWGGSAEQ